MGADVRIFVAVAAILVELWYRGSHGTWLVWPLVVAIALIAWFTAVPRTMAPVARVILRVAAVIGRVNNVMVLGVLFFAVLSPVGWIMRRGQRRRLGLGEAKAPPAGGYWIVREDRGRNVDFTKMY